MRHAVKWRRDYYDQHNQKLLDWDIFTYLYDGYRGYLDIMYDWSVIIMDESISGIVNTISAIEDKIGNNLDFLAKEIIDLQAKVIRLEFNGRGKFDNKNMEFDNKNMRLDARKTTFEDELARESARESAGDFYNVKTFNVDELDETNDIKRFINHFQMFTNVLYDEQIDMSESDEIRLFNIYVSNRG